MEVTTSIREEDQKTQVDIELTADEVKVHIDAFFKQAGKIRIPGFRPGRAPRKVIEQNYGGHDAVYAEITSDMINEIVPRAIDSKDIIFINEAKLDDFDPVEDGKPFHCSLSGKVKPEMELLSFDPVEVTLPPEEVTEKDIENQLNALAQYYYDFESVEGRPAERGDYAVVDLECTANGEAVQGLNGKERLVQLGESALPTDLDAEIVGMNIGETKEFDCSIEGEESFAYVGADVIQVKVTLTDIREQKAPEFNDDFAKKIGADDMDALREMIRGALADQKSAQYADMKDRVCQNELAKRLYGDVPVAYVTFTRTEIQRDYFNNLQRQGVTLDAVLEQQGITREEFDADVEKEAAEVAAQSLALDALARHLELAVTEEDIEHEFSFVENPEEVRKSWEDAGRMSEIREGILRRKATEWLVENAVVTISEDGDTTEEEE